MCYEKQETIIFEQICIHIWEYNNILYILILISIYFIYTYRGYYIYYILYI